MVEGLRLGSIDVICAKPERRGLRAGARPFSVAYLFKDIPHFRRWRTSSSQADRRDHRSRTSASSASGFYAADVRNIYSRRARSPARRPQGREDPGAEQPDRGQGLEDLRRDPDPDELRRGVKALQSGVLDAAENGLAVIESNKHYKAAKFISQTEHQRNLSPLTQREEAGELAARPPEDRAGRGGRGLRPRAQEDAELVAAAPTGLKSKGATLTPPTRRSSSP